MSNFNVFCDKYLSHFTHKKGEAKLVGLEKEILVVDEEGFMSDVSEKIWPHLEKQGFKPIFDSYYKEQVVGYWLGGDQIALDAGRGTLEIILEPRVLVSDAEFRMKEILGLLLPFCDQENISLLSLGIQPKTKPARENWNRKQRYEVLLDYFGEPIYQASLSASDQVHVDVVKEDIVSVINVMNGFAGFFVSIFSNCPVFKGANHFKAYRELIWDELGGDRTGLPKKPISSVEDYLARTWDMKCIMAEDKNEEGKYYSPGMKFRDFVADFDDDETFEAYKVHEGTIWFCARPRIYGTIEMRPAGLQPWDTMVCVSALSLGLIENLSESEMFLKDFRWEVLRELRFDAVRKGFDLELEGKPMADFVKEVLILSRKGLMKRGNNEEVYLDPLYQRVEEEKSPADYAREYLKQGGIKMLIEKNSLKLEHIKLD